TNDFTDRIYLAAHNGLIVCLHDRLQPTPLMNRQFDDKREGLPQAKPDQKGGGEKPKEGDMPKEGGGNAPMGDMPKAGGGADNPKPDDKPKEGAGGGAGNPKPDDKPKPGGG